MLLLLKLKNSIVFKTTSDKRSKFSINENKLKYKISKTQ